MSNEGAVELEELERDALTELVNIGVSRAAASLARLAHDEVLLSVPSVVMISRTEAAALIGHNRSDPLVAIRQAFQGAVTGRALLIFPERNSLELVRAVAGQHLSLEDILELEHEALAEIGNIILNACMATVANLFQRGLTMSLPEVIRGTGSEFFELATSRANDVVLFVHIHFSLKGHEVRGYVAMVMDFATMTSLKDLIAEFIQRMTG
jgi:chemotaxis protein CheC